MDPLGLAAGSVGSAVTLGLGVEAATTLIVDAMRPAAGAAPDLDAPFYLLLGGTLAGIALAGLAAWYLLSPIESVYRRGGLALVSAFATVMVMLVCIPINQAFGRAGLGGLLVVSLMASLLLARHVRAAGARS